MDTTFLIDLIHKNPSAEKKLRNLVEGNDVPCTTVVTVAALFYGAYKSKNVTAQKENIKQVLSGFLILEMNAQGAKKFGQISQHIG